MYRFIVPVVTGYVPGGLSVSFPPCVAMYPSAQEPDQFSNIPARSSVHELGGDVVEMPCRWLEHEDRAVPHAFHRDCALELLNASAARGERVPRCPTCRDDFPPHLLVAHPEDL